MIYISNIQRFSVHDGPGIRTTVFFKGCGLRCLWCHNPETFTQKPVLQFFQKKCIGCGHCVARCPQSAISLTEGKIITDRAKCKLCGECVTACPNEARELNGKAVTPEEIMETVLRDKAYYDKSGGGITLSGGEPLLQPQAAEELLRLAKAAGISTAVETALYVPRSAVEQVIPYVDCFLCDIKALDENLHQALTGGENRQILDNIRYISEFGKEMLLRMPMVPNMNDSEENLRQTAAFIKSLPRIHRLELLYYHSLGRDKYQALAVPYGAEEVIPPDNAAMARYRQIFSENGVEATIV